MVRKINNRLYKINTYASEMIVEVDDNYMYLNVEADSLEEAKETAENTDGGEFINAGSGDWEYDYTEDENGNVIDTGNNDFLREQLKELQADLLDMSDKELVECRSLLLERINWCMTAILERR